MESKQKHFGIAIKGKKALCTSSWKGNCSVKPHFKAIGGTVNVVVFKRYLIDHCGPTGFAPHSRPNANGIIAPSFANLSMIPVIYYHLVRIQGCLKDFFQETSGM